MDQYVKKGKILGKEKNIIECYWIWHQYNDVIKGLEQMEKSWVWSNDKKKMSGDDMSSTPGMMYRKWREQKDMRMKKENCNIKIDQALIVQVSIIFLAVTESSFIYTCYRSSFGCCTIILFRTLQIQDLVLQWWR